MQDEQNRLIAENSRNLQELQALREQYATASSAGQSQIDQLTEETTKAYALAEQRLEDMAGWQRTVNQIAAEVIPQHKRQEYNSQDMVANVQNYLADMQRTGQAELTGA